MPVPTYWSHWRLTLALGALLAVVLALPLAFGPDIPPEGVDVAGVWKWHGPPVAMPPPLAFEAAPLLPNALLDIVARWRSGICPGLWLR